MLKTKILFSFFFLFILLFGACKNKQKKGDNQFQSTSFTFDTADAKGTYLKIRENNKENIDSFYSGLALALSSKNQFELLLRHLSYYDSLNGKSNRTKALISKTKGYSYNYFAKYDSASIYFDDAIRLYKELKNPNGLADAYFGMATNYIFKGDYANAFNYHYKSDRKSVV